MLHLICSRPFRIDSPEPAARGRHAEERSIRSDSEGAESNIEVLAVQQPERPLAQLEIIRVDPPQLRLEIVRDECRATRIECDVGLTHERGHGPGRQFDACDQPPGRSVEYGHVIQCESPDAIAGAVDAHAQHGLAVVCRRSVRRKVR
jgi:hypothetical protein